MDAIQKKQSVFHPQLDYQLQMEMHRATGVFSGKAYIESLKDGREVWMDGRKVDVTAHPAFSGLLGELVRLYDLQHSDDFKERMTSVSPYSGNRVSLSYLLPTTKEQLAAKWENSHIWMEQSWGQLPRVPDFMSNVVVGLYDFRDRLGRIDPRFRENVIRYHLYCQEHNISITHAIGDPQIDRSATPVDDPDMALRVVRETSDGIIIRGAKQLATLAPLAHEVLIYMSPNFALRERPEFVVWCALPMASPGLKILCRKAHSLHITGHSHPFASRYDEQDAMLFFDDVFVPWERVFLLHDSQTALEGFSRLNAWALYVGHIRFYHRLLTLLGVASLISKSIGVNNFREIQNMLGELTTYVEMTRLALLAMQQEAYLTEGGHVAPGSTLGPDAYAAQVAERVTEIVREIGASGIIMQPSEADLASPELRPLLEKYMRGKGIEVDQKSRLFRVAWDLVADSYGVRQEMYEKWYRGNVVRNRISLYNQFDRASIEERIKSLIASPLR
jgi:4-hydroxyphenylacetate 3-monooxygenase oxygenase component